MRDLVAKAGFVVLAGAVLFGASVTGLAQLTVKVPSNLTLVRDIDKQALLPYQTSVSFTLWPTSGGYWGANGFGITNITIPTGKMLVMEYVSASAFSNASNKMLELVLMSHQFELFLMWNQIDLGPNNTSTRSVLSAPVRMYAKGLLIVKVYSAVLPESLSVKVNITGYLVDAPSTVIFQPPSTGWPPGLSKYGDGSQ